MISELKCAYFPCEKCLIFSVNCDTSVIFPVPLEMGNSNKKKREKKICASDIIRTLFLIHTVWQMQTSYARGVM